MRIYKVLVEGWRQGFNKVGCTKLIQVTFDLNLHDSKSYTDAILAEDQVAFQFCSLDEAKAFRDKMIVLCVRCVLADSGRQAANNKDSHP